MKKDWTRWSKPRSKMSSVRSSCLAGDILTCMVAARYLALCLTGTRPRLSGCGRVRSHYRFIVNSSPTQSGPINATIMAIRTCAAFRCWLVSTGCLTSMSASASTLSYLAIYQTISPAALEITISIASFHSRISTTRSNLRSSFPVTRSTCPSGLPSSPITDFLQKTSLNFQGPCGGLLIASSMATRRCGGVTARRSICWNGGFRQSATQSSTRSAAFTGSSKTASDTAHCRSPALPEPAS